MWNRESKDDSRKIVTPGEREVALQRILASTGVEADSEASPEDGPFDTLIAALDAEIPDLISGKRKKDVEPDEDFDDEEEEEEDDLDEEEDEDDFDDEEDEDEFEEEFGDDDLDDDDDDIFYDDDDDE